MLNLSHHYKLWSRLWIAAVVLCSMAGALASAQTGDPGQVSVRAAIEPAQVRPGEQALLKLTLQLAADAHVNSNTPKDPNLIPTSFTPRPMPGIVWGRPQYPEPVTVTEWYSVDPLIVFADGAVITIPLTIENGTAGTLELSGTLVAQVCDHEQCYPAKRLPIRVLLPLTTAEPVATPALPANADPPVPKQTKTTEITRAQAPATDFAFTDFNGKARQLSEFRGKVVLLDFWAMWCQPCLADFPYLKELYAKYQSSGFEIIGLDCETLGDDAPDAEAIKNGTALARTTAARFGAIWTMAETNSAVLVANKIFQVESLPTKILLDRQGNVIQKVKSREELEQLLARLFAQK